MQNNYSNIYFSFSEFIVKVFCCSFQIIWLFLQRVQSSHKRINQEDDTFNFNWITLSSMTLVQTFRITRVCKHPTSTAQNNTFIPHFFVYYVQGQKCTWLHVNDPGYRSRLSSVACIVQWLTIALGPQRKSNRNRTALYRLMQLTTKQLCAFIFIQACTHTNTHTHTPTPTHHLLDVSFPLVELCAPVFIKCLDHFL